MPSRLLGGESSPFDSPSDARFNERVVVPHPRFGGWSQFPTVVEKTVGSTESSSPRRIDRYLIRPTPEPLEKVPTRRTPIPL